MTAQQQAIYTVSQLNSKVKYLLESSFSTLCLLGEVSNLVQAQSGHRYFSLKDGNAQVRCAFFRNASRTLKFPLENGQQILVHANISLYEARGEFQLIVSQIEAVGDGALQLAFEQLKKRLAVEGLFAAEHKKPLPQLPKTIGVITSSSGAAIRDVLKVLKRRCRSINIIIYPSLVQGATAAQQIAAQIELANQRQECDVLLLARGGGSLEDLWAFNEEVVARAVFSSQLPVISGIGHEIDFTIADFVADQRAATPSAAAELISPDSNEWQKQLTASLQRLSWLIEHHIQLKKQLLLNLQQRLRHPRQQLDTQQQRLNELSQRFTTASKRQLVLKQQQLTHLQQRLRNPQQQIQQYQTHTQELWRQLSFALTQQLHHKQLALQTLSQQLNTISPLNTLQRGYAIASYGDKHQVLTDASCVTENDMINIQLACGKLTCQVKSNQE